MRWLRAWFLRLRGMFRKERLDGELAEELKSHLQMHIEDNVSAGMTPKEARRQALIKLGGVELAKENYRDRHGIPWAETLLQDVHFSLRMLRKNPGFAATSILILALGIGASVAIFGFVDAALIKPLPYEKPSRLVGVYESVGMMPHSNLSYPDYLDWKRSSKVFTSLDVWDTTGYLLKTSEGTQTVRGVRVSDGFFRTLGAAPALGRDFEPNEDLPGAPGTVMLSYAAWQKWFGGRPDVIGQGVTLSGISHTIIGVLPRSFHFAPGGDSGFWTTLHAAGSCDLRRSCHSLFGVARLKDGVSVQTALTEMRSIAQQLEKEYPDSNRGQGAALVPLSEAIVGDIRPILLVLLGGAGLLLLIACVNVTSLLLARSESRKREIAVRGALGASFARLVRQFATEGLVLVFAGSALGVISAGWAMQLLTKLIPAGMLAGMPYLQGLGLNLRLVAFACAVALLAAVLFAITPLLRMSLADIRGTLAEGGRGSAANVWRRFGSNLVVVELAIAVVLLVSAGLLGKSFYRLLHVELGFNPNHLAALQIAAPPAIYEKDEQRVALARRLVIRIANLPGVKLVGITTMMPVNSNGNTEWIRFVGRPYNGEHNEVNEREVSSGYFIVLQARLVRGRFFTDAEDASQPRVAVINQALARQYFPGEDPIGKRFGDDDLTPNSIREVIGVVDDIKEGPLDSKIWPAEYLPFNQGPDTFFSVVARTAQAEQAVLPMLSAAVREIDPEIGAVGEATMNDRINRSQAAYLHRSSAWLVGAFASVALLLGIVGLYGVLSYSVSQRTREVGVRIALGAPRRAVYQLILKEAGWLTLVGIGAGLVCAVIAATLMRGLLFGVESWDLPTLGGVAVVLGTCALFAAYVPARRAMRVDPMVALRYE